MRSRLVRFVRWWIPDPLQAGSRRSGLLGLATGAVFGAIAGITWCAFHPDLPVVAVAVIWGVFLAYIGTPLGAIAGAIFAPTHTDTPHPYIPSLTTRLVSFSVNFSLLLLLLLESDAPLPASVLVFSILALPINRTIGAVQRSRHRRHIIDADYRVCPRCDYSLDNLTTNTCPECGTAFDLDALRQGWQAIYPLPAPRRKASPVSS